jgi:hypothetical protein
MCGSLRHGLLSPRAAVLRSARFRSAAFGSGHPLPTSCYQFIDPGGMDGLVSRSFPGVEPGPLSLGA